MGVHIPTGTPHSQRIVEGSGHFNFVPATTTTGWFERVANRSGVEGIGGLLENGKIVKRFAVGLIAVFIAVQFCRLRG